MAQSTSHFTLESAAFADKGTIPQVHTCDGDNISPPLKWTHAPHGTKSFALIVDDPDAPDPKAPKRTWVHWLVYNIPPESHSLDEDLKTPPKDAHFGANDWKQTKWGGPCPPKGRHRYFYKLYALDDTLSFSEPPDKQRLEAAMKGHVLGQATLIGLYESHGH